MKIINRTQFLATPCGTIFSNYAHGVFGDLNIKGESLSNDFYLQQIADAIKCNPGEEFGDLLEEAEKHEISLAMDFESEEMDSMYNYAQMFAVWEKQDVTSLIQRLQQTLSEAYSAKNEAS